MSKESLLPNLLELFRQFGYDGVTLSRISESTGLGKASLYHHFPGGKEQMAEQVLQYIDEAVEANFIGPLKAAGKPKQRLVKMCQVVETYYQSGEKSCICDGLSLGDAHELFQHAIGKTLNAWIKAIAEVAQEAGLPPKVARERAENAIILIQGALILSRTLGSTAPFKRTISRLPDTILAEV